MSHDLLAELEGYQSEQAGYERAGRKDRAAAVQTEVDRVSKAIAVEVEKLMAQADNHEEAGQDILAAQARVEAKRLRRAIAPTDAPPADEDAAESAPRQKAVPPKKAGGR